MHGQSDERASADGTSCSRKPQWQAARESDWAREKAELEARIRGLENENASFRDTPSKSDQKDTKSKVVRFSSSTGSGDPYTQDDTVTLPKFKIEAAERKFNALEAQLEAKHRECAELSQRLAAGDAQPFPSDGVDEADVLRRWTELQSAVAQLCQDQLSQPHQQPVGDETALKELAALSANFTSYLTGELHQETALLFQAAIWRHLHHRLFERSWRCWGEDIYQQSKVLNAALQSSKKVTSEQYTAWRRYTARLLGVGLPISEDAVTTQADRIYAALDKFREVREEDDATKLKEPIRRITRLAAELSGIFAKSTIFPMMSNHPNNQESLGFLFHADSMTRKAQYGEKNEVVGMMISPVLLKKDMNGEFQLLAKADIVTGDRA